MSNTNDHLQFFARTLLLSVFCLGVVAACHAAEFESRWPDDVTRTWIGPQYWANRLQDWRIRDGRLECLEASANKPMRTVHLLMHRLAAREGEVTLSVRLGLIDPINKTEGTAVNAAAGFLIGAGGPTMDYRAAALVHHNPGPGGGLFVGVNPKGNVVIHDFEKPLPMPPPHDPGTPVAPNQRTPIARHLPDDVTLRVTLKSTSAAAEIRAEAFDTKTGKGLGRRTSWKGPVSARFVGNVALVSHPGGDQRSDRFWFRDWTGERKAFEKWSGATARFWFRDWKLSGSKVEADDRRKLGPVISTQYTLHRGTLKLTAQLCPVGPQDGRNVQLQARQGESWRTVAEAPVIMPGYTATFRVEDWDDTRDTPFRVRYEFQDGHGKPAVHHFAGKIRRDPVHKETIVVAAFTGNMQVRGGYEYPLPYGIDVPFPPELSGKTVTESNTFDYTKRIYFPHAEVVRNVAKQQPDLLFFSGDQVYEGNPTRAQEKPYEKACLDYLYKWYLWCWSFRDLTREIPTVTIPDDHDVYQRNIWGDGGKASPEGDLDGSFGGYFMPPEWINMIQRTQTSHLPDPFDPRPAENDIEVYYTALTAGGIGFAIIEDRKFKSFPAVVKAKMSRDSHITEPADYDTREADVPGATLLGERQLRFLHEFAKDWRGQEMKAVLSQTTFANLQILGKRADDVPQEFDIPLDRDLDSNGWPQAGRRRALHEMRRGFMVHIAGDQHLASTIHHGTDEWEDACWSLCVPSIANYYARSWNPDFKPLDYRPNIPPFTGRYEDGFHNKLTVKAVANPVKKPEPGQFPEPLDLHREAPGYGIVRFNKPERTIAMECWPRYVDPTDPKSGSMYLGWPITLKQADNYARQAKAWLPTLNVLGTAKAVVQIIDEPGGEVVYTLRIRGSQFRPKVFREGTYTIRVGQPDEHQFKTFRGVAAKVDNREVMTVSF